MSNDTNSPTSNAIEVGIAAYFRGRDVEWAHKHMKDTLETMLKSAYVQGFHDGAMHAVDERERHAKP